MKKLVKILVLIIIVFFAMSCSVHKKMVKCPKDQTVPHTIWIFNHQIR